MVRFLLENGIGIGVVEVPDMADDSEGRVIYRTPGKCNEEIVEFVLKQGANLTLEDKHNPWSWVRVYWRRKAIGSSENDSDEYRTPDPPHIPENRTGLHWAAIHQHAPLLKLLLEKGASIDHEGPYQRTTLSLAAVHENSEGMKLLIVGGANLKARDLFEKTPLHYAACSDDDEVVQLLLEYGADDTARDNQNSTPLQHAISEDTDFMLPSLQKKHDQRMLDIKAESVEFYKAVKSGEIRAPTNYMKEVAGTGRYIDGSIRAMAYSGNEAMVKFLLKLGAKDFIEEGMNALELVAMVNKRTKRV